MDRTSAMSRGPPDLSGTHSLLVLNISFRTRADQLRQEFSRFGDLADVYIPRNRESGESRGFAFVRYYTLEHAEEAQRNMDKVMLDGREIGVQIARYDRRPVGQSGPRAYHGRRPRSRSRSRSPFRGRGGGGGRGGYHRGARRYDDRYGRRSPPRRGYRDDDYGDRNRDGPPRDRSPERKRFRGDEGRRMPSGRDDRGLDDRGHDDRGRESGGHGDQGHNERPRGAPRGEEQRGPAPARNSPKQGLIDAPPRQEDYSRRERSPYRDQLPRRDQSPHHERSPRRERSPRLERSPAREAGHPPYKHDERVSNGYKREEAPMRNGDNNSYRRRD